MNYLNLTTSNNTTDQLVDFIMEGVLYKLRLRWNERSGWQLKIYDPLLFDKNKTDNTDASLLGEKKLIPAQNFFLQSQSDNLPQGFLSLWDSEARGFDNYKMPSTEEIGEGLRYRLVYFTESEKIKYGLG